MTAFMKMILFEVKYPFFMTLPTQHIIGFMWNTYAQEESCADQELLSNSNDLKSK